MKNEEQKIYGLKPVLTVDQAAEFLGVDRKTVYAAIHSDTIPHLKIGRRLVILRDSLLSLPTKLSVRAAKKQRKH